MPAIEDYIDKKHYFNQLFEHITVAIETIDHYYNSSQKEYETIFVNIHCKLKEKREEVEVIATSLYIELHDVVKRGAFSSSLVPQIIDYDLNQSILTYPGEALFVDGWNIDFEEALLDAVKKNIQSYVGLNDQQKEKHKHFGVRNIWIVD